ncbi:MAG: hypothetical protein HOI69_11115 [Gammaproteobacteria bacterium]|jgi:hypothetical protein|nr:hypothetical protein [Gammaproteobacteria bacterium]
MRGLAEFVMKGRKQAIMAVLLLGLIPLLNLLSPVLVGLVVLRKGFQEAVQVLVWAILPIGGWALAGDPVPLIMLLGITGLAGLLRSSESWEFTLLAAIAVGVCVEIYLRLQPAVLDLIFLQMQPYFEANAIQGEQLDALRDVMTSFMGAVYMFLSIILLMLARWMQAALFNPGGFQKEFHGLRVEQKVALILVSCMMLANFEILIPQTWMLYLVLPLMFSGIALIHAVVAAKKLSSLWLAVLYALIVLPLIANLVVLLALLDSWYDFRTRLTKSA